MRALDWTGPLLTVHHLILTRGGHERTLWKENSMRDQMIETVKNIFSLDHLQSQIIYFSFIKNYRTDQTGA